MIHYYEVTECEHGFTVPCPVQICINYNHTHSRVGGCFCLGGVRREVTIDYEAAAQVLIEDKYKLREERMTIPELVARTVVEAALGMERTE